MAAWQLDRATAERLYREADASKWGVAVDALTRAVERSVRRALGNGPPEPGRLSSYLQTLRVKDLALACACAEGHSEAWDHFVAEYRPILYRAAAAIDTSGGARDLADSIWADLFGLTTRDGERRSHLEYFHGRSSLATWLRAVLAQRHVDRLRQHTRERPLPDDESEQPLASPAPPPAPDRSRCVGLVRAALLAAIAALGARDRLRLACYYAQDLTLAQIGRLLGEHEATVSRQLAKARRTVRTDVERRLQAGGLPPTAVAECVATVLDDPGPLDVKDVLGPASAQEHVPSPFTVKRDRRAG